MKKTPKKNYSLNRKHFFCDTLENFKGIPVYEDQQFIDVLEEISNKYLDEFIPTLAQRQQKYISYLKQEERISYQEIANFENVGLQTVMNSFDNIYRKSYLYLKMCLIRECSHNKKDFQFETDQANDYINEVNMLAKERNKLTVEGCDLNKVDIRCLELSGEILFKLNISASIKFVGQLVSFTPKELIAAKPDVEIYGRYKISAKEIEIIQSELKKYGLSMKEDEECQELKSIYLCVLNTDETDIRVIALPVVDKENKIEFEIKDEIGFAHKYHVKKSSFGKVIKNNNFEQLNHIFLTENNVEKAKEIFSQGILEKYDCYIVARIYNMYRHNYEMVNEVITVQARNKKEAFLVAKSKYLKKAKEDNNRISVRCNHVEKSRQMKKRKTIGKVRGKR